MNHTFNVIGRAAAARVLCIAAALAAATPLTAQLLPFNEAGVTAGHEHVLTTNAPASTDFWTTLGGTTTPIGPLSGIRFQGVIMLVSGPGGRGGPRGGGGPREGSVGSVVESIGFKVKDLRETLGKLEAAGIKPEAGGTATNAAVVSPEKVKVLLLQDASLAAPAAGHELVMKVPNPAEGAAWYAKWFGAKVVTQGSESVAEIPGMNMRFVQAKDPAARTQGRALDHIGFEVKDLRAFMAKLQEGGVTINLAYRSVKLGPLKSVGFVTDPWGTYIELNEGFIDVK